MVSINDVRETVLAICNKNNYGYISPDDFNLYAEQAQLDVFNEFMDRYNYYINLENQHTSGSDLADLAEGAREDIEMFMTGGALTPDAQAGQYFLFNAPDNWYHINIINFEPQPILNPNVLVEVQKSSRVDVSRLLNSNLTAPTKTYPVYVMGNADTNNTNGTIAIAPNTIQTDVSAIYIRYPKKPYWDFVNLVSGEPMFDPNSNLTQDFEVAADQESKLVDKILEKAGLSIREPEVYKTAAVNDNQQQ
tara:strand:- start:1748 stop:2494 length:747 start_codon:yes stop_codon:yes gene_type:complete